MRGTNDTETGPAGFDRLANSAIEDRTCSRRNSQRVWTRFRGPFSPIFDTLAATVTSSATSLTTNGLMSYIPQSLLEFDDSSMEIALTKEAESTTTIDLNERGYMESTAAAHNTLGIKLWINPPFPKIVVFNALVGVP